MTVTQRPRGARTAVLSVIATVAWCLPSGPAAAGSTWVWPLIPHHIMRTFDRPAHDWLPGHRGVDLAGHQGDVVRAAGAGRVVFAGSLAGKGVVVVSHGALRTTYEPVSALVVVGQRVAAGHVIGMLSPGQSHCSRQVAVTCLHWGLRRGRTYLNPLLLVGSHPRLLPQW